MGKQKNARQLHQLWHVETTDHTNMTFISIISSLNDLRSLTVKNVKDFPYEYRLIDLKLNLFVDTCDFVKNKNILLKEKKGEMLKSLV
jgi:transposase